MTRDLDFAVDKRTDDYAQQRDREQVIHDRYHPRLNRMSPISPRNPRREYYSDRAKELEY
jgi:hypothetical protein